MIKKTTYLLHCLFCDPRTDRPSLGRTMGWILLLAMLVALIMLKDIPGNLLYAWALSLGYNQATKLTRKDQQDESNPA